MCVGVVDVLCHIEFALHHACGEWASLRCQSGQCVARSSGAFLKEEYRRAAHNTLMNRRKRGGDREGRTAKREMGVGGRRGRREWKEIVKQKGKRHRRLRLMLSPPPGLFVLLGLLVNTPVTISYQTPNLQVLDLFPIAVNPVYNLIS